MHVIKLYYYDKLILIPDSLDYDEEYHEALKHGQQVFTEQK